MARALIVGCGCRGRELAGELIADGWAVRGTSRNEAGLAPIAEAGAKAAPADPDRPGSVLELVGDVAVVHWLLGSAAGEPALIEAIHGPRLERLLEKLVDTPVRGFVYEAAGSVDAVHLARGAEAVEAAGRRWRIPVRVVRVDPGEHERWLEAMVRASNSVLGG